MGILADVPERISNLNERLAISCVDHAGMPIKDHPNRFSRSFNGLGVPRCNRNLDSSSSKRGACVPFGHCFRAIGSSSFSERRKNRTGPRAEVAIWERPFA